MAILGIARRALGLAGLTGDAGVGAVVAAAPTTPVRTLATAGLGLAASAWAASVAIVLVIRGTLACRFGAPAWTTLATPLAVALMLAIQVNSYLNVLRGRPVTWRARVYAEKKG